MIRDYSKRLEILKNRRTDYELLKELYFGTTFPIHEGYEKVKENDIYKYILGAMEAVDEIYTNNTYKEGNRVKKQLDRIKTRQLDFEYKWQGSVSNNTHIRAHSDIDILVILTNFVTLESPQEAHFPYNGEPIDDLVELRNACYSHLNDAFPKVEVDNSGSKSISLEGGSLNRKVDVVPSNWYNTLDYAKTKLDFYRAIQILDYHKRIRILNKPFLHNELLDKKDKACYGNYKRVIRLLKTLKVDSGEKIEFSSYDIAAIMYHMGESSYNVGMNLLRLIKNIKEYLEAVIGSSSLRNNLLVPDESRKIFDKPQEKVEALNSLKAEIDGVYADIMEDIKYDMHLFESKSLAI